MTQEEHDAILAENQRLILLSQRLGGMRGSAITATGEWIDDPQSVKIAKLERENKKTKEDLNELLNAAKQLRTKMKTIEASDAYKSIWTLSDVHGMEYKGESWGDEADALDAIIQEFKDDNTKIKEKTSCQKTPPTMEGNSS